MIIDENNKIASEKLLSKSTKLTDAEKSEYFKKFYELDPTSKRYPDNPKHLITLIKWFLEDPVERQYELIKVEYETYLEQSRLNQWRGADVVIKDIAKFPKFQDFATEVHRITAKYRKSDSKGGSSEIKDSGNKVELMGKTIDKKDITYMTDEVVVARADTMQKSIQYGSGFSSWCTARTNGNYFYEYRFGSYGDVGASTLYYVYFPQRYSETPNNDDTVLHFGVNEEGDISFTNRSNSESVQTLSWLKNEYPEFRDVSNMQEIFPHKKITSSERKVRDLPNILSDDDFYALSNEDKLMYLQSSSDRVINLNKFKSMSDELKSNYLGIVENSGIVLNSEVLDIIKNTSMGRRYFKNMSADTVEGTLDNYIYRNNLSKLVEIINFLIENKKDNFDLRTVYTVLRVIFNQPLPTTTVLDIGKRLGESNINKLKSHNIKDLLSIDHKLVFETKVEIIGQSNINKLTQSDFADLVIRYVDYGSDTIIRFVLKHYHNLDKILLDAVLKGLNELEAPDIQSVIFKLIDDRKKLGYLFDAGTITSLVKYSPQVSEVMAHIGVSYNVDSFDPEQLMRLLDIMSNKDQIDEFEQHFANGLSKLNSKNINWFLERSTYDDGKNHSKKFRLLLKYTINEWNADLITKLIIVLANHEYYGEQRDLTMRDYLKMFGVARWNEFSSKQLVDILPRFTNIISTIEEFFGTDFILSKLRASDFTHLYVPASRSNAVEKNEKLLEFVVKHYELTPADVILHIKYFPISKFESIVGSNNLNKLTPDDVVILLNNNYIDAFTFDSYARRYVDKILQLSPDQISTLLKFTTYNAIKLFDLLWENNYNFTNEQLVQFILKASNATWNSTINGTELWRIIEKLGKDRIQRLGNDSIVKLGEGNLYKFENLLDYVLIDSLNAEAICRFLKTAYNRGDMYRFKTMFEKLKTVLDKLKYVDIVDLMTLGGGVAEFLFNYVNNTNPSMFTLDFIKSVLKKGAERKIWKNTASDLFNRLGVENINKVLNTLDETELTTFLFGSNDSLSRVLSDNKSFVISLIRIMTPSNLSKISDDLFDNVIENLAGTSSKDDTLRKLLAKPNLNSKNMFTLIDNVSNSFLQYELRSAQFKPIIDQLTPIQIGELLHSAYSVERMKLIAELFGSDNINKINEYQLYYILTARRYGMMSYHGRKMLSIFKNVLYKLSPESLERLKQSTNFDPIDIDMISFIGTGKFTPSFVNRIRSENYKFLSYFTELCFNDIDNIQTPINYYLRALSEYIRSHNNTLNYTEFEVIMREIERFPDVRNSVLHFLSKVLKTKLYKYLKTYNTGRKYNDKVIKEYKRYYSDLLFEDSSFSQENLNKALDIERRAYPPHMQLINSYIEHGGTLDIYDIADYLECGINDIVFYMGSNWFILGCKKGDELEIADWASAGGMSFEAVKMLFSVLYQYKDKTITCDARETTSYRLIKKAERLGYVTVLKEEEWNWGGVKMVDMKFRLSDTLMSRMSKSKKTDEVIDGQLMVGSE